MVEPKSSEVGKVGGLPTNLQYIFISSSTTLLQYNIKSKVEKVRRKLKSTSVLVGHRKLELIASMYTFGTLHFPNSLQVVPESVLFTSYRILAIRGIVSMLLQLTVDNQGCHVHILYQGSTVEFATVLEEVVKFIK